MISFANVAGGLANQMFQYSAGYCHAKRLNVEFFYPERSQFNHTTKSPSLYDIFNISSRKDGYHGPAYNDSVGGFHFKPIPSVSSLTLHGYYQSEKYFKDYENDIRKEFTFINPSKINLPENTISIHVRRGDYLNSPDHHPTCSIEYYEKAISIFDSSYSFLVFSDDLAWCKQVFVGSKFEFSEGLTNDQDLELMSKCNHHILANSSFSWWASWLNQQEGKKTIAPKNWVGPAYNAFNTSDLYRDDWIIL